MAGKKFNNFVGRRYGKLSVDSIHSDDLIDNRRVVKYFTTGS